MPRNVIDAPGAAVGPYSPGGPASESVYLSGQTPLVPATGRLVEGGVEARTGRCLENLGTVLKASGLSFDDVVKVDGFLVDMGDFSAMNEVCARRLPATLPGGHDDRCGGVAARRPYQDRDDRAGAPGRGLRDLGA